MPEVGSTVFVPSDSDGMYKAPENRPVDRIGAILRARLMPVDRNGFPRPKAAPSDVIESVTPTPPPPSMASALQAAAEACGADLPTLLDSQAFVTAITPVSSNDQAELQAVIRDHMPAPVAPGMAVNRAQGTLAGPVPAPRSGSLLERLQQETEKALNQPKPPGSTYR